LDEDRSRIDHERRLLEQERSMGALPLKTSSSFGVSPPIPPPTLPPSIISNEVTRWLEKIGYGDYSEAFATAGYDKLSTVLLLDTYDLDAMDILLPGHRKGIFAAVQELGKELKT